MMGGEGEPGTQQMSGLMNDMSSEMTDICAMIESGIKNPATMKKMGQMRKQMEQMRKDMPASPTKM